MAETVRKAPGVALGAAPYRLLSDRILTGRAAAGSEAAFAAIFARHHQALFRYAQSILGNPEDARDTVQNTMLKMLAALPDEEREIALRPWLFRIAHNEAISIARRRREDPLAGDLESLTSGDQEVRMRAQAIIADLATLPEQQRSALAMRELNGLSHAEIATALGLSEAAAKQTVYAARKALQEIERGREMTCEESQRRISDGDRRRLRGRGVGAHLRACADCRAFERAIGERRAQLGAVAPLPATLSLEMLSDLLSSGGGPGGGLTILGGSAAGAALSGGGTQLAATALIVSAAGFGVGLGVDWGGAREQPREPLQVEKPAAGPTVVRGPAHSVAADRRAPAGERDARPRKRIQLGPQLRQGRLRSRRQGIQGRIQGLERWVRPGR
jgi:RNA polymerase sigma factor (sigma-70 family)